jgi:exonuclease SbcD
MSGLSISSAGSRLRAALEAEKSHEAVLTAAMDRVRADLATRAAAAEATGASRPRAVVMAHAFITGGAASDSERDVSVGGIADAPASVFAGVDYVALGHLHGPQELGNPGGPRTRYSGSPLPYSFSEESHEKSVTIVDIDADGLVSVELAAAPVPRRLRTIRGDLDTLLTDPNLADAADDWVRAIVTDVRRPENPMERLRERFPHAIELAWVPHVDGAPVPELSARVDPASTDPVETVLAFVEHITTKPATDAERALILKAVEQLRIQEAGR